MSGSKEREKRRQERVAVESKVDTQDRRKKMLQIGAGAAFLAVVVVVALIVIASSGSDDGGDAGNIKDAALVEGELSGLEQNGLVLGDPSAPVELVEFGDLQCPVCKLASEKALPPLFEGLVAEGKAKISFRNFVIISEESEPAGAAAIAAGMQGRGWNYIELFYRNQGAEASGYVTDEFLTSVAKAAGVKDIAKWEEDRESAKVKDEVKKGHQEAIGMGLEGTPTFLVKGPNTNGLELIGNATTPEPLEDAIEAAG